jgi:hypothetical protein
MNPPEGGCDAGSPLVCFDVSGEWRTHQELNLKPSDP